MSIPPIEGFKKLSTKKKVAVVAGTAAAVGVVALAHAKGKTSDAFVKAANDAKNNVEGAKKLGFFKTTIEGFKKFPELVKGLFSKKAPEATEKVAEKVEAAAEQAGKAAEKVAEA